MNKPTNGSNDEVLKVIGDLSAMIADRFEQVDVRFEAIDKRFDMIDARFDAMDARFDRLESRVDKIETGISRIYGILDAHFKKIEDILHENQARDAQNARLERWIFQLADAADVKLKYD